MRETHDDGTEGLLRELGWVRALARRLVRDASVAEDLVQETCLAVLATSPGSAPRPRGFLRAVLHNALRARVRSESARRERERAAAAPPELPSPDELVLRMERQRLLAEAVLALDEPFRSTVILRYLEGIVPAEIARRQGVPAGTVRRRLKTGLERLRERLDHTFGGDRRSWAVALIPLLDLESTWIFEVVGVKTAVIAGAIAMKKTLLAACALVLAAGAIAVSVLVREADGPRAHLLEGEPALARPESRTASGGGALLLTEREESERTRSAEAASASAHATLRISGRVLLPVGCEHDETLEVLALDRPLDYAELARLLDEASLDARATAEIAGRVLARGPVSGRGDFDLSFSAPSSRAHLAVRGRMLYLPETRAVDLEGIIAEVVLEPRAGAWITGRLDAQGDREESVGGTFVRLLGMRSELTAGAGILGRAFGIDVRAGEDGRFELRGVPVDLDCSLFVLPERLAAQRVDLAGLAACGRREVALTLRAGASLRGRVVDAAGETAVDAEVEASLPGRWLGLDDRTVRLARSNTDGDFELRAVPAGPLRLRAWKAGWLDSEKLDVEPVEGGELSGLELVLGRGHALSGKVAFERGAAAAGAEVTVEFDRAFLANETTLHALRGARGAARADGEGRFTVGGLGEGPFVVRAATTAPDGMTWRARRDGVRPDAEPLELALHPSLRLSGVVVDSRGMPVVAFEVEAVRIVEGALGAMGMTRERRRFADVQGRFALEHLDEGAWSIEAETPGWVSGKAERVHLPRPLGADPLTLVLQPAASVAGRVLQPDGRPATGAEVRVETGSFGVDAELMPGRMPPRARAVEDGRFRLESLAAGSVRIVASTSTAGSLASAPIDLSLAPGQKIDGIVILLRVGARLTGEVYDDRGLPAAGHLVHLESSLGEKRFTRADERGRFDFEHLAPGRWQVVAVDMDAAVAPPRGTAEMDAMIGSVRLAYVELAEGATQHVVLGAASAGRHVRVHGTVTQAGRPRGGGWIVFFPSNGGGPEKMKIAPVDREGGYEVTVPAPGAYTVSLQQMLGDDESTIDFTRDVPAASSHRIDFALPAGRLAGRVLGPDGRPAAGARVTVASEGSTHAGEYSQGQYTEVLADAGGRFDVTGLRGGIYALAAGGPSDEGACFARVLRGGIALAEGAVLEDVDFRLPEPGSIRVRARDASDIGGQPIAGAAIFVRDADGTIVDPLSSAVTGEDGRGAYACLAPGTYTVLARAGELASDESAPVRVLAGEEAEVELRLVAGTSLKVELRDRDGRAVNGWVHVLDDKGREVGSLYPASEVEQRYYAGHFSPSCPVFGPLPPGRYRVEASAPGGLAEKSEVTLSGERELSVTLVLQS